jgi:hypothetical protein
LHGTGNVTNRFRLRAGNGGETAAKDADCACKDACETENDRVSDHSHTLYGKRTI